MSRTLKITGSALTTTEGIDQVPNPYDANHNDTNPNRWDDAEHSFRRSLLTIAYCVFLAYLMCELGFHIAVYHWFTG